MFRIRLDGHVAIERRMGVAKAYEIDQTVDDRAVERTLDLGRREVMPVDRPAIACSFHRVSVVHPGEETDVVDLRDTFRKELERTSGDIAFVVLVERRVVRAVELMYVAGFGVGPRQDPLDVPAAKADVFREAGHLVGREDPIEIRANGNPVVAIEVRELPIWRRR